VFDIEYESPYPRSEFQKEALQFREDRSHGLEKYTLGLDLLPLWKYFLSDDTPKLLIYLPSFKIRHRQELTQNTATLGKEGLFLLPEGATSEADFNTQTVNGVSFRKVPSGQSYSFRTRYRFSSITWPVFTTSVDSTDAYYELRIGAAKWSYSRLFVAKFPQVSQVRPVLYEASLDAFGAEVFMKALPRRGLRWNFRMSAGAGDLQSTAGNKTLDQLFAPAGKESAFDIETGRVTSYRLAGDFSFRVPITDDSGIGRVWMEMGITNEAFLIYFDVFDESTLEDEESSNDFAQTDIIFLPWAKLSLSF